MLQTTFLFTLILAHIAIGIAILLDSRGGHWMASLSALLATVLFGIAAINAESIQVATDAGLETTSEPVIGIYAFMFAVISLVITVVLVIEWLPTPGGASHGY